MANRFPIYSQLLKLYPKQYRQDYEQQMLQTLADMLDDQPESKGRVLVWIRTSSELPIGIAQQNITNLGATTMNKLTLTTNKRLVGLMAVIVVIVVAAIFVRAQAGQKVINAYASVAYGHGIKGELSKQNQLLLNPMAKLYGQTGSTNFNCASQGLSGPKYLVDCVASRKGYATLAHDKAGKQFTLANVAAITAQLAANGYHAGNNGVTLSSLVGGTYEGKDYSPDADYTKNFGAYSCTFDTFIAYANPKPAAISSQFYCQRTLYFFGASPRDIHTVGASTN